MKKTIVIQAPVDSYSGYGARARDFIRQFIKIYESKYNILLFNTTWGGTPNGFIDSHLNQWEFLKIHMAEKEVLNIVTKDVFMHFGIPSEMPQRGQFNLQINVTAGIQTDAYPFDWIKGMNRSDVVIFSSNHGRITAQSTKFMQNNEVVLQVSTDVVLDVIQQGSDLSIYNSEYVIHNTQLDEQLNNIPQDFLFLITGNLIQTGYKQDRKDIYTTIKVIADTFKNKQRKPGLLIKTNLINNSVMDKNKVLSIIYDIIGQNCGIGVYLLHGELTDREMSQLYNHEKVKSLVSFTHGQGYGRPIQQFALTGKPVLASNCSGIIDFLSYPHVLLRGNVTPIVNPNQFFIRGAKWFTVDYDYAKVKLLQIFKQYNKNKQKTTKHLSQLKNRVSLQAMNRKIKQKFDMIFSEKGI